MTVKASFFTTNAGNTAANQVEIVTEEFRYFQSYDSIIARKNRQTGEVVLDENYWNYSKTTGKYRNEFLGEGVAETRKKIKDGTYTLGNLN